MQLRRPMRGLRRRAALAVVLAVAAAAGLTVLTATAAVAHGASTAPGSRTFLCYTDGHLAGGDLHPQNAECAKAVATGGTQPLWDWFAVLRSDGAGRTKGFIPDGQLCGGGTTKWDAYNTPGNDWPATRLTSGANWTFHYNAWAAHPGEFRMYITKDGYDPSKPLAWSDLEDTPFSTYDETVPNSQQADGMPEYAWPAKLPANKTGRHIIYSVWQRSDSTETFYGCSDVVFDGGTGQVTGIPGYDGQPAGGGTVTTPPTTAPTTTSGSTPTTPVSTPPTTVSVPPTTTEPTEPTEPTSPSGTSTGGGTIPGSTCTAQTAVVSAWPGGFLGNITVLNNAAALTPWQVSFDAAAGDTFGSGWNADYTTSGSTVTATAPTWSRTLATGQQTTIGFLESGSATPSMTNVKLNGVACNGAGSGPVTTSTSAGPVTTSSGPATSTTTEPPPSTTKPPVTTSTPPVSTPPVTTTTAPSAACTDNASLLCDGFEGQTNGAAPAGHWSVVTPDCSGTGKATIDTTTAHSGSTSLKITGGAGYCNHVFVESDHRLDTGGPVYVRLYVKHTTALPTGHVTMIAMNDSKDGNKDLRIGGQNGALQWNRSSDDATLPEQSPAGVAQSSPLPTTGWQCLEYKIDGNAGTAQTWLNGKAVAGLTADGVATHDVDGQWYANAWHPEVTNLKVGWESYAGDSDTLWYDDISAGSARINC